MSDPNSITPQSSPSGATPPPPVTVADPPDATSAPPDDAAPGRAKRILLGLASLGVLGGLLWWGFAGGTTTPQQAKIKPAGPAVAAASPQAPVSREQLSKELVSPAATPGATPALVALTDTGVSGTVGAAGDGIFLPPSPGAQANVPVTEATPTLVGAPAATPATPGNNLSGTVPSAPRPASSGSGSLGSGGRRVTSGLARTVTGGGSGTGGGNGPDTSAARPSEPVSVAANPQKAYWFFDSPAGTNGPGTPSARVPPPTARELVAGAGPTPGPREMSVAPPVRPPFNTVIPLQTLGAVDTLRPNGLVRLVVTRTVSGAGWTLPHGTIFVGRGAGDAGTRAYPQILGYVAPSGQGFVRLGGELSGTDGAAGLPGTRKRLGSRWLRVFAYLGERAYQSFNTWLSSRNGGNQTNVQLPAGNEVGLPANNNQVTEYVWVPGGTFGYFTVTELPADTESAPATLPPLPELGANASTNASVPVSDEDAARLLATGDVAQVRAALPRMGAATRQRIEALLNNQPLLPQ